MQIHKLKARKCDEWGCGHFGAGRGDRDHKGVDLAVMPGTLISSPVAGHVTKLGYVYRDDLTWRYVEVEAQGYRFRFFYVDPRVNVSDTVNVGDILGAVQPIAERYPKITPHIHFEIKNPGGEYVDPMPALLVRGGPVT